MVLVNLDVPNYQKFLMIKHFFFFLNNKLVKPPFIRDSLH